MALTITIIHFAALKINDFERRKSFLSVKFYLIGEKFIKNNFDLTFSCCKKRLVGDRIIMYYYASLLRIDPHPKFSGNLRGERFL